MEILSERLAAARAEQAELERRLAERQALVQEALALAQQNHVGRGAHFRVEWPVEAPPGGPDV